MAFKIGDIVQLKSGGPKMSVTNPKNNYSGHCDTIWFAGSKRESGSFPLETLQLITDEKK